MLVCFCFFFLTTFFLSPLSSPQPARFFSPVILVNNNSIHQYIYSLCKHKQNKTKQTARPVGQADEEFQVHVRLFNSIRITLDVDYTMTAGDVMLALAEKMPVRQVKLTINSFAFVLVLFFIFLSPPLLSLLSGSSLSISCLCVCLCWVSSVWCFSLSIQTFLTASLCMFVQTKTKDVGNTAASTISEVWRPHSRW